MTNIKGLVLGIVLLGMSGLNLYLPNVGNDFDFFRIGFSFVAFALGWCLIIKWSAKFSD